MASSCPMAVPTDPASLAGPPIERPGGLMPWGFEQVRSLHHQHPLQFSPTNRSDDGWAAAIRASQFRERCDRLLLIEDDLAHAGLGFTAKIWAVALLVAMRDNRVLVEVRMRKTGNGTRPDLFERPRWCDREPFTQQCMYLPWTHCPLPPADAKQVRPGGRPLQVARWPHDAPYVRTGLGRIHRQGKFWYGARSAASQQAGRFLFRPRKWVTDIGDCVMRGAGLRPQRFVSVHIRHSVEKRAEGKKLGVSLPDLPAYGVAGAALARDVGTTKVFLQTASPVALQHFESACKSSGLELSYTNNSRSEHDAWGGWKEAAEMEASAVAAVNAYIGSQAALSVSPTLSIWTLFLGWMFGPDGQRHGTTHICCPREHCGHVKGGSFTLQLEGPPALLEADGRLAETTSKCMVPKWSSKAAAKPAAPQRQGQGASTG